MPGYLAISRTVIAVLFCLLAEFRYFCLALLKLLNFKRSTIMKKTSIWFAIFFSSFIFTECGLAIHEDSFFDDYIYQNKSSYDILVKSYSPFMRGVEVLPGKDSLFTISKDAQIKVTCWRSPLNWHNHFTFDKDSVIVSNGNKEVINRKWENDPLYLTTSYKVLSVGKRNNKVYEFTFTDEFFEE
jgi:hypothetical protein